MAAKEKWLGGDIPGAQAILAEAFKANEDSESIFLAAAKLASETGEMEAAMQILEKAKAQADTERVSSIPWRQTVAETLEGRRINCSRLSIYGLWSTPFRLGSVLPRREQYS